MSGLFGKLAGRLGIVAAYLAGLTWLQLIAERFNGFTRPLAIFLLCYCGLIALAQLGVACGEICRWLRAESQELAGDAAVVFETESEAT